MQYNDFHDYNRLACILYVYVYKWLLIATIFVDRLLGWGHNVSSSEFAVYVHPTIELFAEHLIIC